MISTHLKSLSLNMAHDSHFQQMLFFVVNSAKLILKLENNILKYKSNTNEANCLILLVVLSADKSRCHEMAAINVAR